MTKNIYKMERKKPLKPEEYIRWTTRKKQGLN